MTKAFLKRWLSAICTLVVFVVLLTVTFRKPVPVEKMGSVPQRQFIWLDPDNVTIDRPCRNSVQGKKLIADERGYLCSHKDLLNTGCCKPDGNSTERYCCTTCLQNRCCKIYEHCVSCCMQPNKRYILAKVLARGQASKTPLLRAVVDTFDLCLSKCRTSSTSVLRENIYRDSVYKHCYGLDPPSLKATP